MQGGDHNEQWAEQALAVLDLCSHSPKVPQGKTLQREEVVGSVSQLQNHSWVPHLDIQCFPTATCPALIFSMQELLSTHLAPISITATVTA